MKYPQLKVDVNVTAVNNVPKVNVHISNALKTDRWIRKSTNEWQTMNYTYDIRYVLTHKQYNKNTLNKTLRKYPKP